MGVMMADILCFDAGATRRQISACTEFLVTHPRPHDPHLRIFVFNSLPKAIAVLGRRPFDAIVVTLGTPGRSPSGYPVVEAADRLGLEARRFVVTTHPVWRLQAILDGCYKNAQGENIGILPPTVIMSAGTGLVGVARAVSVRLPATDPNRPQRRTAPKLQAAEAHP